MRNKLGLERKLFRGLFEAGEGLLTLSWPLHREYKVVRGTIYGEGYDGRSYEPLEDPDLFLSFTRLGSKGEPSERRILGWVMQHGLLTGDRSEGVNQTPMTVEEFCEEVRCARELAALFMDIRERNAAAIYTRFVGEDGYHEARLHTNPLDRAFARLQTAGPDRIPYRLGAESPDDPAHIQTGAAVFESILAQRLEGVSLRPQTDEFDADEEGGLRLRVWKADEPYRPILAWRCPDLLTALYLQFALMTTSTKPWRRCKHRHCRMPFIRTRSDKYHCGVGCRVAESRARN